ncbi:MAG: copper resistance protein B [Pacificimonas sp.]
MRTLLGAVAAATLSWPAMAQDHDAHAHHSHDATDAMETGAQAAMPHHEDANKAVHGRDGAEAMDHGAHHAPPNARPMDHSGHNIPNANSLPEAAPEAAVPPRALEGPRHAADVIWGTAAMAPARAQLARENGDFRTGSVLVERLEARFGDEDAFLWDVQAFYGGDLNRFVLKSEGEGAFGGTVEDAEIQTLYSRAITPFFDLQAGLRVDPEPNTRTHAVLGIQGLAPYMFHVDGALFLSDRGDLTARVEAEYDQKITQRLILQPRLELEAAAQDIPERETRSGFTKFETGLRLRYEIEREFAPYLGIGYEAALGETADLKRDAGEDPDGFAFLLGIRAWF